LNQPIDPASRGVSRVEESEAVELLQERIDRLVADFCLAKEAEGGTAIAKIM
jgi:hypothetical protein